MGRSLSEGRRPNPCRGQLERTLRPLPRQRPPEARDKVDGEPRAIAEAIVAAYHRGLANFHAFARAGLFWLYLESNVALDGRFLDLETPLYFGGPFVGIALSKIDGVQERELIGFEEFGFTRQWRTFVHWLLAHLRFLQSPLVVESREARSFLRSLEREITRRAASEPWMTDDAVLNAALDNLAPALGLDARDRTRLGRLARAAFGSWMYGRPPRLPDAGSRPKTESTASTASPQARKEIQSLMRWYRIAAPGTVPDPVPPADAGPWYRTLNDIHYGFFGARGRWALSVRFEPDFTSWSAANAALKPLWSAPHRTTR